MAVQDPTLGTALKYSLRMRCPRCGKSKIFESYGVIKVTCPDCGLVLRARENETWFFMYMSTAFITGLFVIGMFLVTPPSLRFGRWGIASVAILGFWGTHSVRKSMAIAIDYWFDSHREFPRY